jgi:predicted dehydrogenase
VIDHSATEQRMKKPASPLRVAVVGTGGIARGSHLPALATLGDRAEVVALVDVDTEALGRTADDWSVPGRYSDLATMLDAERPDLVVGVVCSVVNSLLSPRQTSYLRFDLTDATVEVEHLYGYGNTDWRWTPAPHVTDDERVAGWPPVDDLRSSHAAQLASLARSMERGERPRASGPDGRRSLELITGMYRSALSERTVLRSDLTPGDPFVTALHGGDPASATARLRATPAAAAATTATQTATPTIEESFHA